MNTYRTAWISDLHLGTRGCSAEAVLYFIREYKAETLYIVGDLIDIWQLRRTIYWPQTHNDVIQKILREGRKGTRLIYIPGNHDEMLRKFTGEYGNLTIVKRAIHQTADGRRLLVIHGDELDTVIINAKWLAYIGDAGYQFLLKLNGPINYFRRIFGLGHWSLSAYVKKEVKNVVSFIGAFEEAVVRYSKDFKVDGVLCGHIHSAAIRKVQGIDYYNSGDFVESCTALVEHHDGRIELITDLQTQMLAAKAGTEPVPGADDEENFPESQSIPGRYLSKIWPRMERGQERRSSILGLSGFLAASFDLAGVVEEILLGVSAVAAEIFPTEPL